MGWDEGKGKCGMGRGCETGDVGKERRCWEGERDVFPTSCSDPGCAASLVFPAGWTHMEGQPWKQFCLHIFSLNLCWATAKILCGFPACSSLWGAAPGAVIPQISSSLLIGNLSWQDMEFFSKWLLELGKPCLEKSFCPSELQTPPDLFPQGTNI